MGINKRATQFRSLFEKHRAAAIQKTILNILITVLCCMILRLYLENESKVFIFDNTYKSYETVIPSTTSTQGEPQNNAGVWIEIGLHMTAENADLYDSCDLPLEMNIIPPDIIMNLATDMNILEFEFEFELEPNEVPLYSGQFANEDENEDEDENETEETETAIDEQISFSPPVIEQIQELPETEPERDPHESTDGQSLFYTIGEYTVTAYCPCVKCCGIWSEQHPSRIGTDYVQKTASGTIPKEGRTCGADPKVLPYGTILLINGHEYIVEDTGSGANGKKLIDVFRSDHASAIEFGRQKTEVWVKNQ